MHIKTRHLKDKYNLPAPGFQNHHKLADAMGLNPAQTLKKGLEVFKAIKNEKRAADLGCGTGTDTLYLLNEGWQVCAIDKESAALEKIEARWPFPSLTVSQQTFEEMSLPQTDLINASFALPFCLPAHFNNCWLQVVNSLSTGGIFCGHFFGERDSWSVRKDMTFHSTDELNVLFKDFEIKWQFETEKDGQTLGGESKHWHVHHIVACKF